MLHTDGKMDATASSDTDFKDESSCYILSESSGSLNSTASTVFSVKTDALRPSVTSVYTYNTLVAHLKKENFQLKLRLYEMDMKLNAIPGVDSKIQVINLQKENDNLTKLLQSAGQALDVMEKNEKDLKAEKKLWEIERKVLEKEKERWEAQREKWEAQRNKWEAEKNEWEVEREKWETNKENWEVSKEQWETDKKRWEAFKEGQEVVKEQWETQKENWEVFKEKWETDKKMWEVKEKGSNVVRTRPNMGTHNLLQVPQRLRQRSQSGSQVPKPLAPRPKPQQEQQGTLSHTKQNETKPRPGASSRMVLTYGKNPYIPQEILDGIRPSDLIPRKPSKQMYQAVMGARVKSPFADANRNIPSNIFIDKR